MASSRDVHAAMDNMPNHDAAWETPEALSHAVRVLATGLGLWLGLIAAEPGGARAQAVVRGTLPGHKGQTGANRVTMKAHDGSVRGIAITPEGRSPATASTDKTAKLVGASPNPEQKTRMGGTSLVVLCRVI